MTPPKIRRALISVYDKTGIVDFARALVSEFGIEIISTGGTAKLLKESGIPVTLVEEVTGFPEMLDGRVKTLHPKIHAAILADRDNPEHMRQLEEQGIKPIDMVVVNLYPFEKTVADPNCKFEDAIEMIDIGGPCLLRAAAKNHRHVLVAGPDDEGAGTEVLYERVLHYIGCYDRGIPGDDLHPRFAKHAFWATSDYDDQVHHWLQRHDVERAKLRLAFVESEKIRYGENPHQAGSLVVWQPKLGSEADVIAAGVMMNNTVEPSFNNYADAHSALELCKDLARNRRRCVGPTFQSVIRPVVEQLHTRRHLPHIQDPGAHYFVTFRLATGQLSPDERRIVLDACKHWHGTRMTVHACVVMPDHVHLLLTPHERSRGEWVPLGEIARGIKGFSAREINRRRGRSGSLWLDESWDRIMRNEKEFGETWEYIENNPAKEGLGEEYPWLWMNANSWEDLAAHQDRLESRSHTDDSRSHRASAKQARNCLFIKHTNACGVGIADDPLAAYRLAYLGDPNAAMGGILACSFSIDATFASAVMDTYSRWGKEAGAGGFFVEVWIAPEFAEDAVSVIRTSKPWGERVRLLSVGEMSQPPDPEEREYKSITGGMLVQTRDLVGLNEDQWKVVTRRTPSESEISDLRLAWLIAKHTKSNAISICKDGMLIGNGAGQMSRVMSCRIATWLAKENGHAEKLPGSVAASDAFFPFADGPKLLIDAGVTALIQPGGSKRDEDTIKLCDASGVAMIHTGTRHFKH